MALCSSDTNAAHGRRLMQEFEELRGKVHVVQANSGRLADATAAGVGMARALLRDGSDWVSLLFVTLVPVAHSYEESRTNLVTSQVPYCGRSRPPSSS